MRICSCGKEMVGTGSAPYSLRWFDAKGKLIFAMCHHGTVVIDRRKEGHIYSCETELTPPEAGIAKKDRDARPEFARKSTLMKR